jgi:hypothetical protein
MVFHRASTRHVLWRSPDFGQHHHEVTCLVRTWRSIVVIRSKVTLFHLIRDTIERTPVFFWIWYPMSCTTCTCCTTALRSLVLSWLIQFSGIGKKSKGEKSGGDTFPETRCISMNFFFIWRLSRKICMFRFCVQVKKTFKKRFMDCSNLVQILFKCICSNFVQV